MKFIKTLEAFIQKNDNLLIVEKGTELFHGTGEVFNKSNLKPGYYDKVLWTCDSSVIAQTYIPISSYTHISTRTLANPRFDERVRNIQKQLGIEYDYNHVKFEGDRAVSYKSAPVFKEFEDKYYDNRKQIQLLNGEYTELKNKLANKKPSNEEIAKREELYAKIKELENKLYNEESIETLQNDYINNKLKEFGYTPTSENDDMHHGCSWKLKTGSIDGKNILLPFDYKTNGRLLIIKPKRDIKIYDTTIGGKRNSDLTDLDYHKHNWFEKAEKSGYDGIRITDFAQSVDNGNVGHLSIGLFEKTLKDVIIDEIPAVHQELDSYFGSDWKSPEYKDYKLKINKSV